MNRFIKIAVLGSTIAAVLATSVITADARDRYYRHHHGHAGDYVAAGVLGAAAGLVIGGALADRPTYIEEDPVYVEPEVRYVQRPRTVYVDGGIEPWTPEWRRYCYDRYRSFDARSGTFIGNDGREHFCVAN